MTGPEQKIRRCVIGGSTRRVEANHVVLRQMRLDLRYTPDPVERAIRVLKTILVFAWMVLEGLQHASTGAEEINE
jgi:hypothetical protein